MAISAVLAPAVTQTSSLGIFTLFNLSHERIPKQTDPPDSTAPPTPPQRPSITVPPRPSLQDHGSLTRVPTESSLSSSPRSYPTDCCSQPILEECDESESDAPNEPVTPVSGRQSQDFHHAGHSHDISHQDSNSSASTSASFAAIHRAVTAPVSKAPVILNTAPTPTPPPSKQETPRTPRSLSRTTTGPTSPLQDPQSPSLSRRSSRSHIIRRTMSSFFKRSHSNTEKAAFAMTEASQTAASDTNLAHARRQSNGGPLHKSLTTTQSNTPPTPGSPPLEIVLPSKAAVGTPTIPSNEDFSNNFKKKSRASTGLSLHKIIHFGSSNNGALKVPERPQRRRASSFGHAQEHAAEPKDAADGVELGRHEIWPMPAEAGTGLKARRMSLSLPDDFTVDVADLHSEFDYLHKMGRHRKHLGKGATSKVTLMFRKGYPDELYAVKEFRGKSTSETKEEYEKKVKSEYSIAKALHHPNIVETIRLCTDHGRWNHVMEYCQEGDLYSLVEKGYLKREDRMVDRNCLFKQLIQGVNYLHSNGIAHRDIKLENLLITSNSKLKITDFGVSEVFSGIHPGLREAGGQCGRKMDKEVRLCEPGICGSQPYISPEVLEAVEPYDPRKLDVWGCAIIMINMCFGGPLWKQARDDGSNPQYSLWVKGFKNWQAKRTPDAIVNCDEPMPRFEAFAHVQGQPVLRALLYGMLNPNPALRLTIDKVANHRWMKGVECCQLDTYDDPARFIDASKKGCTKLGNGQKIYCHDHLPLKSHGHSLGKMPGQVGY
jgi:protein-serine/threonine kinase